MFIFALCQGGGYSLETWFNASGNENGTEGYIINLSASKDNLFNVTYVVQKVEDQYISDWEFEVMHRWEHLKLSASDIRQSSRGLVRDEVNILARYGRHYAGVTLLWVNKIPSQGLKYGVEYNKKWNLLLSQPEVFLSVYTTTTNFKKWTKEIDFKGKINLFTFGKIDFYTTLNIKIYQGNWDIGSGILLSF